MSPAAGPGGRTALVFLDLETTGLDPGKHEITEIGAVRVRNRRAREFRRLVRIRAPVISDEITRLTGITTDEIERSGVGPEEALADLARFAGPEMTVVGHNIDFDLAFLEKAGFPRPEETLDTALLAALLLPEERSYRLSALARNFSAGEKAHRALADARQCRRLFRHLLRRGARCVPADLLEEMAGLLSGPEPALGRLLAGMAGADPGPARPVGDRPEKGDRGTQRPRAASRRAGRRVISRFFGGENGGPERAEGEERALAVFRELAAGQRVRLEPGRIHWSRNPVTVGALAAARAAGPGEAIVFALPDRRDAWHFWHRELPGIRAALSRLTFARLLPPGEYLCREKLGRLREEVGKAPENRLPLAYLVSFARQSREGILSETASFLNYRYPDLPGWLERLGAAAEGPESCLGPGHEKCFLPRALARAAGCGFVLLAGSTRAALAEKRDGAAGWLPGARGGRPLRTRP